MTLAFCLAAVSEVSDSLYYMIHPVADYAIVMVPFLARGKYNFIPGIIILAGAYPILLCLCSNDYMAL